MNIYRVGGQNCVYMMLYRLVCGMLYEYIIVCRMLCEYIACRCQNLKSVSDARMYICEYAGCEDAGCYVNTSKF